MRSWNTIKKSLRDFSRSHPLVNSFGTGNILSDDSRKIVNFVDASTDRIYYPLVFAEFNNSRIQANSVLLNVGLIFMDKMEEISKIPASPSGSDAVQFQTLQADEVMSDMLQLATDYVVRYQMTFADDFNMLVNQDVRFFVDDRSDRVAGCRVNCSFEVPFPKSLCKLPIIEETFTYYYGTAEEIAPIDAETGSSKIIQDGQDLIITFDASAEENAFLWLAIPETRSLPSNWFRNSFDQGLFSELFQFNNTQVIDGISYHIYISQWQTLATDSMQFT